MASRNMIKTSRPAPEDQDIAPVMCKFGTDCKFIPDHEHPFADCKKFREPKNDGPCKWGIDCHIIPGKEHNWSACKALRDETRPRFEDDSEKYCLHCDKSVRAHPNDKMIQMLCRPHGDHDSDRCRGCWCPQIKDRDGKKMIYAGKPVYKDAQHPKFGCGCKPENRMDEEDAIDYIKTKTEKAIGHAVVVAQPQKKAMFPSLPSTDDDKASKTNNNNKKKKYLDAIQHQPTQAAAAVSSAVASSVAAAATAVAASVGLTGTTTPNAPVPFPSPIGTALIPIAEEQIANTPRGSDKSDTTDFEIEIESLDVYILLRERAQAMGKKFQCKLIQTSNGGFKLI